METNLGRSAVVWNSDLNCFISEDHARLAEVLHDYNPYFSLVFIPPAKRDATDTKPFAILDSSPGVVPYVMRYLSELEMKDTPEILAWIFNGDLRRNRPEDVFDRIRSRENAEKLLKQKQRMEELEDAQEFAEYAFKENGRNYFRHNGQKYGS